MEVRASSTLQQHKKRKKGLFRSESVIVSWDPAALSACRQQNNNLSADLPAGTRCEIIPHTRRPLICFNEHSRTRAEESKVSLSSASSYLTLSVFLLLVGCKSRKYISMFVLSRPQRAPKRLTRRLLTTGLPGLSLALTRQNTPFMRAWAPSPHRSHLSLWWKVCRYAHSLVLLEICVCL